MPILWEKNKKDEPCSSNPNKGGSHKLGDPTDWAEGVKNGQGIKYRLATCMYCGDTFRNEDPLPIPFDQLSEPLRLRMQNPRPVPPDEDFWE